MLVLDGFYTVEGFHGHYTFKIATQKPEARFAPGRQILSYLRGPVNTSDYTGLGFIQPQGTLGVWKSKDTDGMKRIIAAAKFLLAGAFDEAGRLYAVQSGNCYICNRLLTTPESIARGIGPVCASRQ